MSGVEYVAVVSVATTTISSIGRQRDGPHAHLYTETYAPATATNTSRDTVSQGHPLNNCPFYASLSPPAPPPQPNTINLAIYFNFISHSISF